MKKITDNFEQDLLNFHYLQVIVERIFQIVASEEEANIKDKRNSLVKPNTGRLNSGFALKVKQDSFVLESICTPWGEWECFGASTGSMTALLEKIKAEFGIFDPYLADFNHLFFAISAIKDPRKKNAIVTLPDPSVYAEEKCTDYDECMAKWRQMKAAYKPLRLKKRRRE